LATDKKKKREWKKNTQTGMIDRLEEGERERDRGRLKERR
jgi:hypothetical protein